MINIIILITLIQMIINEARVKKEKTQEEIELEQLFKPVVQQNNKFRQELEESLNKNVLYIQFVKKDGSIRSGLFTRNKLVLDSLKDRQIGQGINNWVPKYSPNCPCPMFDITKCIKVDWNERTPNYIEQCWRSMASVAIYYGYFAVVGEIDALDFIEQYQPKTIEEAQEWVEAKEDELMSHVNVSALNSAMNIRVDLMNYTQKDKYNSKKYSAQYLNVGPYQAY